MTPSLPVCLHFTTRVPLGQGSHENTPFVSSVVVTEDMTRACVITNHSFSGESQTSALLNSTIFKYQRMILESLQS